MNTQFKDTNKKRSLIVESFQSFSELLQTNDTRKNNFGYNREIDGRGFDFGTYQQAVDMLYDYDKHLQKFKTSLKNIDKQKTVDVKKTKSVVGVQGFQPIVPNALMGLPNSMIGTQVVSKKSKILNVVIDGTYPYNTSSTEVANHFSKSLAYLVGLEKQGFRVRISLMFLFANNHQGQVHVCKILLKSENQPIDLKRLMFPLTNLGSFRLFGWDWYERLPLANYMAGYGQAIYTWNNEYRQDVLDSIGELNNKAYLLHLKTQAEEVFKNVK